MTAVARAFAAVDDAWLSTAPLDDVRTWLRGIHGVGAFTSAFVLYRGLGRYDGIGHVAPRLVEIASQRYGRSLRAADLVAMARAYGAWGGHWMLYLWASSFLAEGHAA